MPAPLIRMDGEEFVRKILGGERRFSDIALEEGFDLSGHEAFSTLQAYLKGQDLRKNPLHIDGSDFKGVHAAGLYLPYVDGRGTNLEGANLFGANLGAAYLEIACLRGANLREARLGGAYLVGTNFERADLQEAHLGEAILDGADLMRAHLEGANLVGAHLDGANLFGANLERANLRHVKNLAKAFNVEYAHFFETRVTSREAEILNPLLVERILRIEE